MYYNPQTHLDLARARHADLIREARRHELARLVEGKRPSTLARVKSLLARKPVEVAQPAAHAA